MAHRILVRPALAAVNGSVLPATNVAVLYFAIWIFHGEEILKRWTQGGTLSRMILIVLPALGAIPAFRFVSPWPREAPVLSAEERLVDAGRAGFTRHEIRAGTTWVAACGGR